MNIFLAFLINSLNYLELKEVNHEVIPHDSNMKNAIC